MLIKVDDTGVGGGVTDEIMKRGYNVMAINFGAKADDPDKYPNLISEAWFYLASIIDHIQIDMDRTFYGAVEPTVEDGLSKGRRASRVRTTTRSAATARRPGRRTYPMLLHSAAQTSRSFRRMGYLIFQC